LNSYLVMQKVPKGRRIRRGSASAPCWMRRSTGRCHTGSLRSALGEVFSVRASRKLRARESRAESEERLDVAAREVGAALNSRARLAPAPRRRRASRGGAPIGRLCHRPSEMIIEHLVTSAEVIELSCRLRSPPHCTCQQPYYTTTTCLWGTRWENLIALFYL